VRGSFRRKPLSGQTFPVWKKCSNYGNLLQVRSKAAIALKKKLTRLQHIQQFEFKPATKMVNFKDVKKGDDLEMAAYSIDLRQKILSAWQNFEGTQRELAKRFKVSLSFLRDFLRRYRETGEIAARTLLRGSPLEA
jgi:hypothetical protein